MSNPSIRIPDSEVPSVDSDAAAACAENLNRDVLPVDACEAPEGGVSTSGVCAVVTSMKRLVRGLSS
jgi:hypothetical protein